MPANDYQFVTTWAVAGTCEHVSAVLGNPIDLPRWWPMVYLDVVELRPPDAAGLGRRVRLVTKGKLPYKIRWEFEVVASRPPYGFTIAANGDFEGTGVWSSCSGGRWSTSRSTGGFAPKSRCCAGCRLSSSRYSRPT